MKKSDPYELMKKSNPYEMMKKSKFSFLRMIREPGIHAPHAVGPTTKSRFFKFRDLDGPGPFSKTLGPWKFQNFRPEWIAVKQKSRTKSEFELRKF